MKSIFEEKKNAGVLSLVTAALALLASILWFQAKNMGQALFWLGFAVLWAGFYVHRRRKKEPIQPTEPTPGSRT